MKASAGGAKERLPRPVDAVTFDCWNTLIYEPDWETARTRRVAELRAVVREGGREVALPDAERAFGAAWQRHVDLWNRGVASGAPEIAAWAFRELGLEPPPPLAFDRLVAVWQEASHSGAVTALEGARATLERLEGAGVRRALVCDTGLTPGRVVRRLLDRVGLLEGLEVLIFSDEIGVPKPHPRAFEAALKPLGASPERAVHVGDLRRTDVAGARGAGMAAVRLRAHFDDTSDLPEADAVADSHADLLRILGLAPA